MILQSNIPALHRRSFLRHPPLVRRDTRKDKQHKVQDQNERQKDIRRDLHLSESVDEGIARLAPEIEVIVARDEVVELDLHGLPEPEPAVADGENEGGEGETPYEEIEGDVPAGVNGFAVAVGDGEKDLEGVVDEGEEELWRGVLAWGLHG